MTSKTETENEFLLYHILKASYGVGVIDYEDDSIRDEKVLKNVCAKMHVRLVDRIDAAIDLLSITKTQFITAAVLSFLDEFEHLFVKYDHPALVKSEGAKS